MENFRTLKPYVGQCRH